MEPRLFDFANMAKNGVKTAKAIGRQFEKLNVELAGPPVIDPRVKRTSGISFREVTLLFKDSQKVVLRVKQTGDIWQVLQNGREIPLKNHTDQVSAIKEIVASLNAKRKAFQKRLTMVRAPIKERGLTVTRRMLVQKLKDRSATLTSLIDEAQSELDELRAARAPKAAAETLTPTSSAGYAKILAESLQEQYQDTLDSHFGARIVDVRNALRDLGWAGKGLALTKSIDGSVHSVSYDVSQVGAGKNVVGVSWSVDAGMVKVPDGFERSPAELAAFLDKLAQPPTAEQMAAVEAQIAAETAPAPATYAGWTRTDAGMLTQLTDGKDWLVKRTDEGFGVYIADRYESLHKAEADAIAWAEKVQRGEIQQQPIVPAAPGSSNAIPESEKGAWADWGGEVNEALSADESGVSPEEADRLMDNYDELAVKLWRDGKAPLEAANELLIQSGHRLSAPEPTPANPELDWLNGVAAGSIDISADLPAARDRIRAAQAVPELAGVATAAAEALKRAAIAQAQKIIAAKKTLDAAIDSTTEETPVAGDESPDNTATAPEEVVEDDPPEGEPALDSEAPENCDKCDSAKVDGKCPECQPDAKDSKATTDAVALDAAKAKWLWRMTPRKNGEAIKRNAREGDLSFFNGRDWVPNSGKWWLDASDKIMFQTNRGQLDAQNRKDLLAELREDGITVDSTALDSTPAATVAPAAA